MKPNPKKSFIAHITAENKGLSFIEFEDRHAPAGAASILTTRVPLPPGGPQRAARFLIAYFECYDDYYKIQIRSDNYFGNYIGRDVYGMLAAFPTSGTETTSFNLLDDDNQIITLDDLDSNDANVYLKVRNAGIINIGERPMNRRTNQYFSVYGGDTVKFNLEILRRNPAEATDDTPDRLSYYYDDEV